jgi:hypothetical protein
LSLMKQLCILGVLILTFCGTRPSHCTCQRTAFSHRSSLTPIASLRAMVLGLFCVCVCGGGGQGLLKF